MILFSFEALTTIFSIQPKKGAFLNLDLPPPKIFPAPLGEVQLEYPHNFSPWFDK